MKILIELPKWLGDAVMATPAIENLTNFFNDCNITIIGSSVSVMAIKCQPKVIKSVVLDYKYKNLYKNAMELGKFDMFVSFRGSLTAQFLKFCISAKRKYHYDGNKYFDGHQVEKYNNYINNCLGINSKPGKIFLNFKKNKQLSNKKLLGINPGAAYGSAKRWYPEEFASLACQLSCSYNIIIFGGMSETNIASDIERKLIELGVNNYQNLAGKTNINELINYISKLDLFVTGDSGPMHIAAAFQIPTTAIFGPTQDQVTCQWRNEKSVIVKKNLDCQPCLKRQCPLGHHNCMKQIYASEVINAINTII